MVRVFGTVILTAGMAGAQVVPAALDAAVVGVLEAGRVVDEGVTIRAAGQLRVVRTLAGELKPNDRVPLAWEYRAAANEPREPEKRLPQGACLWLLKRAEGEWRPEPYLLDRAVVFAGAVAYPLPGDTMPPQYWPPPGSSWQRAVAHEMRWSMEALAQQHGAGLNPRRGFLRGGAMVSALTPPQRLFTVAANLLWQLPEKETRDVYRLLSESAFLNARMSGLAGLLRAAEPRAGRELERDWPMLEATLDSIRAGQAAHSMPRMPLQDQLALARIAVSDVGAPNLERTVALSLWSAGPVGLPYLAVLLEHPAEEVRSAAVMSLCQHLGAKVRNDRRYCPPSAPVRDPVRETEACALWRAMLREMGVEAPPLPSRYSSTEAAPPQVELPPEERFWLLAVRLEGSKNLLPLPAKLDERDRESLSAICASLLRSENERRKAFERLIHERRLAGATLERSAYEADSNARQAARGAALEEARRQLSAAGWQALEEALAETQVVRRAIPVSP
ncbi:MAG: hypothetical protein KJZ84_18255 [Bryobacteraceae bacterium]|nr:hypothetical protein [Bryobacteraceae bacterium]